MQCIRVFLSLYVKRLLRKKFYFCCNVLAALGTLKELGLPRLARGVTKAECFSFSFFFFGSFSVLFFKSFSCVDEDDLGILFSCLISISVVGLKETFMFWIFKKTHLDIKKQNKNKIKKEKRTRENYF